MRKFQNKEIINFNNNGITLVALIVTIVILIILATITISILVNGSMIDRASRAGEKYQTEQEEEKKKVSQLEKFIDMFTTKKSDIPTFGTPNGEKKISTSKWYTGDVLIPINMEKEEVRITYIVTGADEQVETEGTNVTIKKEGTSVITAYAYYKDGKKIASKPLEINIDKSNPPKTNLTYSKETNNSLEVNTSGEGEDTISGIAKYIFEYKLDTDANWNTSDEFESLPTSYEYKNLTASQKYNFRVRVVDNAGNESIGTELNISLRLC